MKKILQFTLVVLMVGLLVLGFRAPARAQEGAHYMDADTYTHSGTANVDKNYGNNTSLLLAGGKSGPVCTETSFLWYKFDVPNTGRTIAEASFFLQFVFSNGLVMDMELLGSTDASWSVTTLTWNTQAPYEASLVSLGTAESVDVGTAEFIDDPLNPLIGPFLNANQGSTVTFVVHADCPGGDIGDGATRVTPGINESSPTPGLGGAYILMEDPTAVELLDLNASSQPSVSAPTLILVAALVALPTLAWFGSRAIRRRKS